MILRHLLSFLKPGAYGYTMSLWVQFEPDSQLRCIIVYRVVFLLLYFYWPFELMVFTIHDLPENFQLSLTLRHDRT